MILIPAWNESTTLERCVESLLHQSVQDWRAVIAAGGPDETLQLAEELTRQDSRFRVIEQSARGKNAALADAWEQVDGEVIVVLDADSVVDPLWLASMLAALADGSAAVCGNYFPLRLTWVSHSEQMEKVSSYLIRENVVLQGSGSIAVRRKALEQAGGFPSHITVGVDWDLDARLKERGFKVGFAREARVFTERPSTPRAYWRNEIRWRRAHLAATWRHRQWYRNNPRSGLIQISFYLVALTVAFALMTLIVAGVLGWFSLGWLSLLFLLWVAGRRAALAAEVAAYEGRWSLMRYAWIPIVILFVSFAAALVVLLTPGRLPVQFQGPRDVSGVLGQPTIPT